MNVRPVGYTFFRDGRVLPRHMAVSEPALGRIALPTSTEGYGFITPNPGDNGALPRLTLYGPDGKAEITYFGPTYGKQPKTKAEAIERVVGGEVCESCKTRKYKDGSNDAGVSFKSPAHISLENSAAVVAAHEQEHVLNAYSRAEQSGGHVAYSSVRLFTASCPECGRMYVSGGVTESRIVKKQESARLDAGLLGQYIDMAV